MPNEIPKRFATRLLAGGLIDTDALAATREAFDVLVLSGGPGCGKTLAACGWLSDRAGLFVSASELARWPRYDMAEMRRLLRAPHLVIDDLGTEYMDDKGNFMAVLDEVINSRYANELPTVITTNLDAEGFKLRYGSRIVDRIRECGTFYGIDTASIRHKLSGVEKETIAAALQRVYDERAAAAEKARYGRDLCKLHLYGPESGNTCNKYCPAWPKDKDTKVPAFVRELADSKTLEP